SIIIFLVASLSVNAQEFTAIPVYNRMLDNIEKKNNVQYFKLPIYDIYEYVQSKNDSIPLSIHIGRENKRWILIPNKMMSENVRVRTSDHGLFKDIFIDKKCTTFKGINIDNGEIESVFISDKNIFFKIKRDGHIKEVYSTKLRNKGGDRNTIIMEDIDQSGFSVDKQCGTESKAKIRKLEKKIGIGKTRVQQPLSCREVSVGIATDASVWSLFDENVEDIIDFNLTLLGEVELLYDNFNLDFMVTEIYIHMDFVSSTNPWGEDVEASALLSNFGDFGDANFDTDIGHVWTNRDINNDGNSITIGRAWVGGACGDIGIHQYAILELFSSSLSDLALLQAHEYGHLFDADHEPNTGTIMEPSLGAITSNTWAAANIIEMEDFIEDETCLFTCAHCPFNYHIIDQIVGGTWVYSSQNQTTTTADIKQGADVTIKSQVTVKLLPGFNASSLKELSGQTVVKVQIGVCE
nr:M12 family metallo-peptidase [Saprospiraceae bacterium]